MASWYKTPVTSYGETSMKPNIRHRIIAILSLWPFLCSLAQENNILVNTDWDHERHAWASSWITHPTESRSDFGVFLFRNSFNLETIPDSITVYVSADNRYRLLVNGHEISRGPARGSLMHWRYETLNIAPYLHVGENIIASEVYNLGPLRPAAQYSYQTAFIFQAKGDQRTSLNTPGNWTVWKNEAYEPIEVTGDMVRGYYVAGPTDRITGSKYPWGWESVDFDDSNWEKPVVLSRGVGRGYMHGTPWMLVPRNIPMMEQSPEHDPVIREASGIDFDPQFPALNHPLTIPAESSCTLLLDQGYLTTTYPIYKLAGGKGASLRATYAESLYDNELRKGNRDQVEGKQMIGCFDMIIPEGGAGRVYRTLTTRTYRYLELRVTTGAEPLIIEGIEANFTAYPFVRNASFSAGDPFLDELQEIGWRTARLCASETYMDCPYYEQLQYLGDTRIQALISLYVSGDDRLMRNALLQADQSRMYDGLTLSRAPSAIPQIIPPFSLYWIDMVHDFYMHREDDPFVRSFLPGIQAVLGWFERRMGPDGLMGGLEWLNFSDWSKGFMVGSPPGVDLGGSALVSLNFAYALERAAELFQHFEDPYLAERYANLSHQIKSSVFDLCYNEEKGLLADTREQLDFSQHTNIFGILSDCIPDSLQHGVMERILDDSTLVQTTIYYRFYLFRALFKAGLGDHYLGQLGPWKEMIDKGLTTWEEGDYEERSDCHAWGSSPNYDLLSIVCGINPGRPGFREVSFTPNLGDLEHVKASMPHPLGTIRAEYDHTPGKQLKATIELPRGTSGEIRWGTQRVKLKAGSQTVLMK